YPSTTLFPYTTLFRSSHFVYKIPICKGERYDWFGNQEGHRRTGRAERSPGRTAARLRIGAAHRAADQWGVAFHARGALSHALSDGAATLDSRHLGNQRERAATPLLQADAGREEEAGPAPARMGGTVSRASTAYEGCPCLIGGDVFASACHARPCM